METCRKLSLVLLFMVLSLLVIACAGLLQCWCSNILKTMIDRDQICIWDMFIMFEAQNFYFGLTEWSSFCSAAQPTSCWSDAGHRFTWDYGWFVLVFLYRHLGNHLWAINFWLSCCLFPTWFVSGQFHLFLTMDMHKFAPCPWTWFYFVETVEGSVKRCTMQNLKSADFDILAQDVGMLANLQFVLCQTYLTLSATVS